MNVTSSCAFCEKLVLFLGRDLTSNYLDDDLRRKMRSLKSDGDAEILRCPDCGKYYYFRQWAPGGSEDAMTTTKHQDFYALSPYELYALLYPNLEKTEAIFLASQALSVVSEAISILKQNHSAKVHPAYAEQALASERTAAEILRVAFVALEDPPFRLLAETAALLTLSDEKIHENIISAIFSGLEKFAGDESKFNAAMQAIEEHNAQSPVVVQFVADARLAHAQIMQRVYEKIINPRAGTPACPECKSANIGEAGGEYDLTLMKCYDCGNEEYCDLYEVGDWYI